jgi:hypothetical protein
LGDGPTESAPEVEPAPTTRRSPATEPASKEARQSLEFRAQLAEFLDVHRSKRLLHPGGSLSFVPVGDSARLRLFFSALSVPMCLVPEKTARVRCFLRLRFELADHSSSETLLRFAAVDSNPIGRTRWPLPARALLGRAGEEAVEQRMKDRQVFGPFDDARRQRLA